MRSEFSLFFLSSFKLIDSNLLSDRLKLNSTKLNHDQASIIIVFEENFQIKNFLKKRLIFNLHNQQRNKKKKIKLNSIRFMLYGLNCRIR